MTITIEDYLTQVLVHLPPTTPLRQHIAMELRGHIEARLAAGVALDEVLRQLGPPADLASSYLAEVPLTPAGYGPRLVAKVIDVGIFFVAAAALALAAWLSRRSVWLPQVLVILAVLVAAFGYVVYTIVAEWRWGQTLGKQRCGLFVVQESGAPITLGQAIVRQLSALLQVVWIDAMFMLFTERRQRAFELLSKTRVIAADTPAA